MGSDAELFLFEYDRYRDEVVPAFTELTGTGLARPWLTELIEAVPTDPDLLEASWRDQWTGVLLPHIRQNPGPLARHWRDCTPPKCDVDEWILELFEELVEAAVTARCLSACRFVGRTQCAVRYLPSLTAAGVADVDPLHDLLTSLASRGRAIGHRPVGTREGIHGWLSPAETAELADRLGKLPLESSPDEFDRWSLPRVHAKAAEAATKGLGVLWGNDVFLPDDHLDR